MSPMPPHGRHGDDPEAVRRSLGEFPLAEDDPAHMRALPQQSSRPNPFAGAIVVLFFAAFLPAYAKVVYIIARWSWELIG
jgi:hypothetical protein